MAHNLRDLGRLHWVMQESLTRTLAAKLRISVSKVYKRYRAQILTEDWTYTAGLEVRIEREGKTPLIARWGGISLVWKVDGELEDQPPPFWSLNTTELVQRLLADKCELCGSRDNVQVHHIRALKDLEKK